MVRKTATSKLARVEPAAGGVAGLIAGLADQPTLLTAALGTIGAGVVAGRGELIRGGARMLAAQLVAAAMTKAVGDRLAPPAGQEIDRDGVVTSATGPSSHLTEAVVGGIVGWLAEAVVVAVFDRIEPAVERAIAARAA